MVILYTSSMSNFANSDPLPNRAAWEVTSSQLQETEFIWSLTLAVGWCTDMGCIVIASAKTMQDVSCELGVRMGSEDCGSRGQI